MATKGFETRERIVQRALDLIHAGGFSATSMNDIVDATGVKKGNLYFHFSGKEELGLEVIREARRQYNAYLRERITGNTPLEKIESLLEAIVDFHRGRNFSGGCIFGNTALELGGRHREFSALIADVFREWTDMLSGMIDAAQAAGQVRSDIDTRVMARHIVALLEGGVMMSKLSGREDDLGSCVDSVKTMMRC
ncbi:MAG TPA: TetR/AcrR family transcriptional regulator [Spirochaetota bacterium]|nr:TetR/AcrR family transcriptional regulator [Spirochaetota bacterium]